VTPRERGQYQLISAACGLRRNRRAISAACSPSTCTVNDLLDQRAARLASLALLLPKMGKIPVFHRKRKVDWIAACC